MAAAQLLHLQDFSDVAALFPLTFDVLHLPLGDRVKVQLHKGPQEVGVRHHAFGSFPVKLLVAFDDEDALTDRLHLPWGLRERPGGQEGPCSE